METTYWEKSVKLGELFLTGALIRELLEGGLC